MTTFNTNQIFDTGIDFNTKTLAVFRFQAAHTPTYKKYLQLLNIEPDRVNCVDDIPFMPIGFFKTHDIIVRHATPQLIFESSGTTSLNTSKHLVAEPDIYRQSFMQGFARFYGNPHDYVIFALLPGYLERSNSSLVYMVKHLIDAGTNAQSGFYLNNYAQLRTQIEDLKMSGKKMLLLGVSHALLDMALNYPVDAPNLIVMETGGMKGRHKELVRQELHGLLQQGFGVSRIHSEYGMTELLSQAYSTGDGRFSTPPWMQIHIRDLYDPFAWVEKGATGGINIIDLANIYSCSFIETMDLGKKHPDNTFEVLGRFDNSDIRGCNLLVS